MSKKKITAIIAALLALLGTIKAVVDALPDSAPALTHTATSPDAGVGL